jgi:hypothetical protein
MAKGVVKTARQKKNGKAREGQANVEPEWLLDS